VFQILRRFKRDRLFGRDLNRFTRLRVPSLSCFRFFWDEAAESTQINALTEAKALATSASNLSRIASISFFVRSGPAFAAIASTSCCFVMQYPFKCIEDPGALGG